MPRLEPDPEQIVIEHRRDIQARSDVDEHDPQALRAHLLGEDMEDWGDGWYVNAEPVLVQRGPSGEIVRTTPLSEIVPQDPEEAEPVVGRTVVAPTPISAADRHKLVYVLASRLLKWYASQPRHPAQYNPLYDGIPDLPAQSPHNLQPLPGTDLYPASPGQVLEWLKQVIGKRAQINNVRLGRDTYRPSLTFKRTSV